VLAVSGPHTVVLEVGDTYVVVLVGDVHTLVLVKVTGTPTPVLEAVASVVPTFCEAITSFTTGLTI